MGSLSSAEKQKEQKNYEAVLLAKIGELNQLVKDANDQVNQLQIMITDLHSQKEMENERSVMFSISPEYTYGKENIDISSVRSKKLPKLLVMSKLTEFRVAPCEEISIEKIQLPCGDLSYQHIKIMPIKPVINKLSEKIVIDDVINSGSFMSMIGDMKYKHLA